MANPKLSILLASFGEQSQRYLNLCFNSIEKQSFQDFEVIHVSSGDFKPHDSWFNRDIGFACHRFHSDERIHFPSAIAKAYKLSDPASEYIMLLNDDVVLDRDCLDALVKTMDAMPNEIILNALCNSDAFGFFYFAHTGIANGEFFHKSQYTYEEMEGKHQDLMSLRKHPFAVMPTPFSCFYATMMKRSTYDKVGGVEARFRTGKDDLDFCLRARKFGIQSMVAMHAAVFHFGGATNNKTVTSEDTAFNAELFEEIHGVKITP